MQTPESTWSEKRAAATPRLIEFSVEEHYVRFGRYPLGKRWSVLRRRDPGHRAVISIPGRRQFQVQWTNGEVTWVDEAIMDPGRLYDDYLLRHDSKHKGWGTLTIMSSSPKSHFWVRKNGETLEVSRRVLQQLSLHQLLTSIDADAATKTNASQSQFNFLNNRKRLDGSTSLYTR
jgi:hypothetical protein